MQTARSGTKKSVPRRQGGSARCLQVTAAMQEEIRELRRKNREQSERVRSLAATRDQLATARARLAEMEPCLNELDDLRAEAAEAKAAVRALRGELDAGRGEHATTVQALQAQLRVLRRDADEAAVR